MRTQTPLVIDCETCPVRHVRCDDCLVTALGPPVPVGLQLQPHRPGRDERLADELSLDAAERRAVDVFVRAGLVERQHAATLTARRDHRPGARAAG